MHLRVQAAVQVLFSWSKQTSHTTYCQFASIFGLLFYIPEALNMDLNQTGVRDAIKRYAMVMSGTVNFKLAEWNQKLDRPLSASQTTEHQHCDTHVHLWSEVKNTFRLPASLLRGLSSLPL